MNTVAPASASVVGPPPTGAHASTPVAKSILSIGSPPPRHWVGNGFPVHGLFGYDADARRRSPFLMLDYAAPTRFEPTTERRGVGTHPHRGFETVTLVYAGEVEHRDSTGQGGVIGPGDVQWMTAGAGILHEEFHSAAYARSGGPFEMVQLWVNLPARDKLAAPGYQAIVDAQIPSVALLDEQGQEVGRARLVAGERDGRRGPARTFTPMNVWDLRLKAGARVSLPQPEGWTTLVLVQGGRVRVNGSEPLEAAQLATLSERGQGVKLRVEEGAGPAAQVLLLAGQPIDEPVVGYGPFVMNTRQEILQAIEDFNAGRFGRMART